MESHSRSQIQKLIADGLVTLGTRVAKANSVLREGERIEVHLPEAIPAEAAAEADDEAEDEGRPSRHGRRIPGRTAVVPSRNRLRAKD